MTSLLILPELNLPSSSSVTILACKDFFFPPWKKKALLTYLGWNVSPHQIRPSNSTPSIPNPLTAFVACDGVQNTSDGGCGAGRAEICEAWRRDTETSWCVQQHSNATS
jgi:hypothetical protein